MTIEELFKKVTIWSAIKHISNWTTLIVQFKIPSDLVKEHISQTSINSTLLTIKESSEVKGMHYVSLDSFLNDSSTGYMVGSYGEVQEGLGSIFGLIENREELRNKYIKKLEPLLIAINKLNDVGYEVSVKGEWAMTLSDEKGYAKKIKEQLSDILEEMTEDLLIVKELDKEEEVKELDEKEKIYKEIDELLN